MEEKGISIDTGDRIHYNKLVMIEIMKRYVATMKTWYQHYQPMTWVALVAVALKLALFYVLMDVRTNFLPVWLLSCLLLSLLFSIFQNKKIPFVIFSVLTVMMFADAAYSSFFNRYLSLSMIGAVGLLGDVTASIREVLKPKFFFLFLDLIPLYLAINRNKAVVKKPEIRSGVFLLLLTLSASNVTGWSMHTSIANQELLSYHTRDFAAWLEKDAAAEVAATSTLQFSTRPQTYQKEGDLFGAGKGRNLIVVQMESFQNFVVQAEYEGQELTPNLNQLIDAQDTIYFNNYFQQVASGNTSDAEYATNNSRFGTANSYTYELYGTTNYFRGLPVLMGEQGYDTAAFHAYVKEFWSRDTAYPGQGFHQFISKNDFDQDEIIGMGLSDRSFFHQSIDRMTSMKQPFYSFLITLSNHFPYEMPAQEREIKLKREDQGTIFGHYLNSIHYADKAIGSFLTELKQRGLYDNSVIVFYGDHFGLTPNDPKIASAVSRYLGKEYDEVSQLNIPLLIHIPNSGAGRVIETTGGQLDFLPTMAYLMGFETLDTVYLGQNLINATHGFVAEQCYLPKGSFLQDDVMYIMSKDGVFENGEAKNIKTGESVPLELCKEGYLQSLAIINDSEFSLSNDVLRKIYMGNQSQDSIRPERNIIKPPPLIAVAGAPDQNLAGTNSLEALDRSYEAGYRYLKVNLSWTRDGRTVLLDHWDTVPLTLAEFMAQPADADLTRMQFKDLSDWMEAHPDAYVILDLDQDIIYLLQAIEQNFPQIMDQIIPVISTMEEYISGDFRAFPQLLYKAATRENTARELLSFAQLSNIWGFLLPSADAEKDAELLHSEQFVYTELEDIKNLSQLKKAGFDGFVITGSEGPLSHEVSIW